MLASMTVLSWLLSLTGVSAVISSEKSSSSNREDPLRTALRHVTGFTDEQLDFAARELLQLAPPSQRSLWKERVHCGFGWCAGEAFARVMAALAEGGKLPLRFFEPAPEDPIYNLWNEEDKQELHSWTSGRHAHQKDEFFTSLLVEGQPLAIGRFQASEFVRRAKARIIAESGGKEISWMLGRCIEWDAPHYTVHGLQNLCWRFDVLTYTEFFEGQPDAIWTFPRGTRQLTVDILKPPTWMPEDYGVVVCFFVLEHVPDPFLGMRGVARLLRPGGFVLLGAPFIDGVHGCPDDYFRYTPNGFKKIVEAAGLKVLDLFAPGTPYVAAGELMGMKSNYWSREEIFAEWDAHPLNVFILAQKPWIRKPARRPLNHSEIED